MILKCLISIFWNFLALTDLLLYGEASFDKILNKMVLTVSMKFILDSDRFTGSIF